MTGAQTHCTAHCMLLSHLLPHTFLSSNPSQPHPSFDAGCRELVRGCLGSEVIIVGLHRMLRSYFMLPRHQQAAALSERSAPVLCDFVLFMRRRIAHDLVERPSHYINHIEVQGPLAPGVLGHIVPAKAPVPSRLITVPEHMSRLCKTGSLICNCDMSSFAETHGVMIRVVTLQGINTSFRQRP